MNYFKSIFQKKKNRNVIDQTSSETSTIYDQNSLTVHLDDIKAIIKCQQRRRELYFRPTKSLLEQLKVLYSLHMMIISEQINDENELIECFSQGKQFNVQRCAQSSFVNNTVGGQTNHNSNEVQMNYSEVKTIDIIQKYPIKFYNVEIEFAQQYYSYLQRVANNMDIYYASQKMQYPYLEENQSRKIRFLWLFKLTNMINFKISMIPMIQKIIFQESDFTQITKEITILIYKDCINEYLFIKKEIEEQLEQYQQQNVKDTISLYELYIQAKQITNSLKLFYNIRNHFLKYERIEKFNWLHLEKQQEKDVELYVERIKLINSSQFKHTLKVPSQKDIYDNLQQKMTQSKIKSKSKKGRRILEHLSPKTDNKKQQSKQNSHRIIIQS
ncbi:unnamed protein product (macronuclear) [Paramecium tetraurelia]|uniref:Uncharacterized protein n=1 Tax=Paramecium tetraurelia TaxID=5888 RepID=A0DKG4_PARTE|nr:uncharacterized protein GSPATT00017861001 [Paramecium tetraurelia]CAK83531.1 unnamed protein product [Paramecium tetraurelia]|eukprot:XP_001450928.1 hypothetical protein (macronuclear) [Paramecium tetraurelia strain d4-2]